MTKTDTGGRGEGRSSDLVMVEREVDVGVLRSMGWMTDPNDASAPRFFGAIVQFKNGASPKLPVSAVWNETPVRIVAALQSVEGGVQGSIATKQATDETAASVTEFSSLQEANIARQKEWDPDNRITLAYRGNELAGEVGEACNVIKKLERERMGINGSRDTVEHLLEELADSVICSYLVAMHVGGDLDAAIVAKFNATSEKMNLRTRMRATQFTKTPSADHDAGNLRSLAEPTPRDSSESKTGGAS